MNLFETRFKLVYHFDILKWNSYEKPFILLNESSFDIYLG